MFYYDKINEIESLVIVECAVCHAELVFKAPTAGLERWLVGNELIQNALPTLTSAERELLISNTCGECFDKMFPLGGPI